MEGKFGLKVHEKDNIATIFGVVIPEEIITIADKIGNTKDIVAKSDIPYGYGSNGRTVYDVFYRPRCAARISFYAGHQNMWQPADLSKHVKRYRHQRRPHYRRQKNDRRSWRRSICENVKCIKRRTNKERNIRLFWFHRHSHARTSNINDSLTSITLKLSITVLKPGGTI